MSFRTRGGWPARGRPVGDVHRRVSVRGGANPEHAPRRSVLRAGDRARGGGGDGVRGGRRGGFDEADAEDSECRARGGGVGARRTGRAAPSLWCFRLRLLARAFAAHSAAHGDHEAWSCSRHAWSIV